MIKRKPTNIHIERARYGLTQKDLALAIGTSRQTVHSIETGKHIASCFLAIKFAMALKTTVEYLFRLNK